MYRKLPYKRWRLCLGPTEKYSSAHIYMPRNLRKTPIKHWHDFQKSSSAVGGGTAADGSATPISDRHCINKEVGLIKSRRAQYATSVCWLISATAALHCPTMDDRPAVVDACLYTRQVRYTETAILDVRRVS